MPIFREMRWLPVPAHRLHRSIAVQSRDSSRDLAPDCQAGTSSRDSASSVGTLALPQPHTGSRGTPTGLRARLFGGEFAQAPASGKLPYQLAADRQLD